MREDMFKVIVERPRRGGGGDRVRAWNPRDLEDGGPVQEGMKRAHTSRKGLNENLNPLKRFLRGSVGRPWNKVYAEICEHLSTGSTVHQHVRDHIEDCVSLHTRMIDGEVWDYGWGRPSKIAGTRTELYVHPESGLLLENRQRSTRADYKRRREQVRREGARDRRREVSPGVQLHLLRGVWYVIQLGETSLDRNRPEDVVIDRGLTDLDAEALYGARWLYATDKRQLGWKEIRKLGLH